ncbi:unnamed protein product [Schistocephalus solidus]|uniref:RNA-binding motif protein, X-linked 2 n=1 Tax=Schistocephalus solidus TaxID=70667 RepID=A0A0X3PHA2_SCHSO|nr:unnamed protein product [Schistocephalus solidus]
MNPLTNTKNQNLMNERELRLGYTGKVSSWHRQYKDSAWIFIGGLNYELTEGDIVCAFSQYGEVANINLVRDRDTGKPKGFAFLCYENQKSTILATDNLNGIKLGGRIIRVDHVEKYKVPNLGIVKVGKENPDQMPPSDSVSDFVRQHGCGPEAMQHILKVQKAKKAGRAEQVSPVQRRSSRSRSPGLDHGRRRQSHSPSPPRGTGGRVPSVSPPRETHRCSRSPPRQSYRSISRAYYHPRRRQESPKVPERHAGSPARSPPVSPPGRRLQSSTSVSRELENGRLPSPPRHRRQPTPPLSVRRECEPSESSPCHYRRSRPSPVSSPARKARLPSVSPPRKARLPSAYSQLRGTPVSESSSHRKQRSPSVSPPRKTHPPSVSPPRRRR